MRARDRRALLLLGLWSLSVGLYLGGRTWWEHRRTRGALRERVAGLQRKEAYLRGACLDMQRRRQEGLKAFPSDLGGLPDDQLRLRGQDSLLDAAGRSGLQGLRLRPQGVERQGGLLKLRWTLDCEGTLAQWLAGLEALDQTQPLMSVVGLHLNLPGDPWAPASTGQEGPSLKGSVELLWTVPGAGDA